MRLLGTLLKLSKGGIIVDAIVAVDRLGKYYDLDVGSVTNDSKGLLFVEDCKGNKIHILDGDGKFLQYIDFQGAKNPCALCIFLRGEIIVGESQTGIAKVLEYSDWSRCVVKQHVNMYFWIYVFL